VTFNDDTIHGQLFTRAHQHNITDEHFIDCNLNLDAIADDIGSAGA